MRDPSPQRSRPLLDLEETMPGKPLSPRSQWLQDVTGLKEQQQQHPQHQQQHHHHQDNHMRGEARDPPPDTPISEDRVQHRTNALKNKITRNKKLPSNKTLKCKKKSSSDPTLDARTPKQIDRIAEARTTLGGSPQGSDAESDYIPVILPRKSRSQSPRKSRSQSPVKRRDASLGARTPKRASGKEDTGAVITTPTTAATTSTTPRLQFQTKRPAAISTKEEVQRVCKGDRREEVVALKIVGTATTGTQDPSSQEPPSILQDSRPPFPQVFAETPLTQVDAPVSPMTVNTVHSPSSIAVVAATPPQAAIPAATSPPKRTGKKKEKKMSWLRKALHTSSHLVNDILTPNGGGHGRKFSVDDVPPPRIDLTKETSPLRQQLWLAQIRQSMEEVNVANALFLEPDKVVSFREEGTTDGGENTTSPRGATLNDNSKYYNDQREAGIVMDYSTFDDDAESVSSIGLLINWLSCKEMPGKDQMRIDHRGKLVLATESFDNDTLSWHEDPQQQNSLSPLAHHT